MGMIIFNHGSHGSHGFEPGTLQAGRSTDDSLPFQRRGLEVEQQGQTKLSDSQVTSHLRDVSVIEGSHDFRIYDD
jgi:hypothetical protein